MLACTQSHIGRDCFVCFMEALWFVMPHFKLALHVSFCWFVADLRVVHLVDTYQLAFRTLIRVLAMSVPWSLLRELGGAVLCLSHGGAVDMRVAKNRSVGTS